METRSRAALRFLADTQSSKIDEFFEKYIAVDKEATMLLSDALVRFNKLLTTHKIPKVDVMSFGRMLAVKASNKAYTRVTTINGKSVRIWVGIRLLTKAERMGK
jgi:hypothetical protein